MISVAIDAGHGGSNVGASGYGITEKDFTLRLAYLVYFALKDCSWGITPRLIRSDDETLSLTQRAALAGEMGCKLAIVLHCNAAEFKADGVRAFHLAGDRTALGMAHAFAQTAPKQLRDPNAVQVATQRNQQNVVRLYNCPAVLYEVGFLSSPKDVEYLKDPRILAVLVGAVCNGVKFGVDSWTKSA